jgi:hypothetical protein
MNLRTATTDGAKKNRATCVSVTLLVFKMSFLVQGAPPSVASGG